MNLWTIIAIILFLVLRSVGRAKAQIRQNNREKGVAAGVPQKQEINWETLLTPKEAAVPQPVKKERPAPSVVPESPALSAVPEIPLQKRYANAEYAVNRDENGDPTWFSDTDEVRRAIVNSEILSRKFDL